jgi:hypothetical protein
VTTVHLEHPDHALVHDDGCGRVAVPRGDHVHDGRRHAFHEGRGDNR